VSLPEWPRERHVPQVIHQTFPVKALPRALDESIAAMRALNPQCEHRLYDDADISAFVERHYGRDMLDRLLRISPRYGAARADLFRYLLLYKEGGVYLDIKSTTRKPLREVIRDDDEYLLSHWRNGRGERFRGWGLHDELSHIAGGEFQQWFIVAAPGHPFLRAVILSVLRNLSVYSPRLHGVGRLAVLQLTGPIAYTLALAPHLDAHRHRIVESDGELALEYTIFDKFKDHGKLFATHYATLDDSIVTLGVGGRMRNRALGAVHDALNRVRRTA
jgi:hypothetical protein